jgi:hypothetical protein
MSDEDKKRIVSQPPPPTDEVDGEWGDDDQTLVRELPEGVTKSQPAPPATVVAGTAVAPISVPAKAAEASTPPEMKAAPAIERSAAPHLHEEETHSPADEAHDESDENDEDDEDEHDDGHRAPTAAVASKDWLPDWAPFAVLAVLVSVSILVGLGLVGGPAGASEDPAGDAAAETPKPASKPSGHP